MKKVLILFLFLIIVVGFSIAQEKDLSKSPILPIGFQNTSSDFSNMEVVRIQPIILDNELNGYCILSYVDRLSEDSTKFKFTFYNENLEVTHEVNFATGKDEIIKSYNYNGKTLCVLTRSHNDKERVPIGRVPTPVILKFVFIQNDGSFTQIIQEYSGYTFSVASDTLNAGTDIQWEALIPVKNIGFLFHPYYNASGILLAFDNDGKELWKLKDGYLCKVIGSKVLLHTTDNTSGNVYNYPTSKLQLYNFTNLETLIFSINISHSSEAYKHPLDFFFFKNNYYLLLMHASWQNRKNKNYWPNIIDNPINYSLIKISESGEIISEKVVPGNLGEDFSSEKKIEYGIKYPSERFKLRKALFCNDTFYFAGERYYYENKKVEYMLISFDSDLKISNKFRYISKYDDEVKFSFIINIKSFYYPENKSYTGYNTNPFKELSSFSKNNMFNLIYLNYEETKENFSRKNFVLETIGINSDKIIYKSSLDFQLNSSSYEILPAKPGYVCIFEYFEKEKKIDFRLEKFDF